MSKPRVEVHPWLTEEVTREQVLKMKCSCCGLVFYWIEHGSYCSAECSEVETAAIALSQDNDDEWRTPDWVEDFVPSYNNPDGRY